MDFQALFDALPDLILLVRSDDRVVLFSNRSARELGLTEGQVVSERFLALEPFVQEVGERIYHFAVCPVPGQGLMLSGRDVTERLRAEREKSELLASLLEQLGEGVAAADRDGQVVVWNTAANRILKRFHLGHMNDASALELFDVDGKPVSPTLYRALAGEEIDGEELLVRHAGCPEGVWVTVTARPLRDEAGHLTGAVAVFRDSTVQRQLTETLSQARDAALQATRLKSEFLANMSHEIRTPLNGIIGLGEMLTQTALDQAQREYVSTIRLCSQSLLSIVNSVLDFSKIEAGKFELDRETFELEATVEEALELAATGLGDKPVELYARFHHELPRFVTGDPLRLRQILLNYLSNAVKFTARGEVVVEVLPDASGAPDLLRFLVHDSGGGVDPGAAERLFQPFSQADSSSKRLHGGTGLGLVISRKLAQMMGGEAGFRAREGGGTSFHFTARLPAAANQGIVPSLHDLPSVVLQLGHPGLLEVVSGYLRQHGARVGLELTSESRLLLSDVEPAGHNGNASHGAHLRVICLGKERPEVVAPHLSFLRKPLKFSRLLRLLREVSGSAHDSGRRAALSMPIPDPSFRGKVLVAEDNPVNRRVMLLMLEKLGLQAQGVENGREAAEAALAGRFDLVLMDCQMPVMDGHEATRLVRERWTGRAESRLPIVAVTANALEGEADRCRQSGMDDYLTKPVTLESLRGVVERWLGGKLAEPV